MRAFAVAVALGLAAGCGGPAPLHDYPPEAAVRFHEECPADNPVCVCTWREIRREMTHDEYAEAMSRAETTGLLDPRLTRASVRCREKHAG